MFRLVTELVELAESKGEKMSDMIQREMKYTFNSRDTLIRQVDHNFAFMKRFVEKEMGFMRFHSGLTIPLDKVIEAMLKSGRTISVNLCEIAQGKLAATPMGKVLDAKYLEFQRIRNE